MKTAVILLLFVGALCWTCTVAEKETNKVDKKVVVQEENEDTDGVLEKILMKMLAKMQDDEDEDEEGVKQDDEDEEGVKNQDDEDEDEGDLAELQVNIQTMVTPY